MLKFIIKRLFWGIPVLWAVATITFIIMHIVPGGPFDEEKQLPPEIKANIEQKFYLDRPLPEQYVLYLRNLLKGDLGPSYKYTGRDVSDIIADTFLASIELGLLAFILSLLFGVGLGIISAISGETSGRGITDTLPFKGRGRPALREVEGVGMGLFSSEKNRWIDKTSMMVAIAGVSIPHFVLATLLILILSHTFRIFPPALWEGWQYTILPALSLAAAPAAYMARVMRASFMNILKEDYLRTCHAKGLRVRSILFKHALKNAITPIVTFSGPLLAGLITGSFVIEYIFSIPGMGKYFVTAVINRDYPLIMGVTIVYAVMIVLANLIVDILYSLLDPRVRI